MARLLHAGTALLFLGLPLRAATAQRPRPAPRLEIGALAGRASADGADFSATNAGWSAAGTLRYRIAGPLSVGVGLHYSDHSLKGFPEHLHIRGVYVEPRIAAPARDPHLRLFVGLRAGWASERYTIVDWTARGWVAGGVVGGTWHLAPFLALELQASETAVHFGNRRLADGSSVIGTAGNGSSLGIQGGLLFTL